MLLRTEAFFSCFFVCNLSATLTPRCCYFVKDSNKHLEGRETHSPMQCNVQFWYERLARLEIMLNIRFAASQPPPALTAPTARQNCESSESTTTPQCGVIFFSLSQRHSSSLSRISFETSRPGNRKRDVVSLYQSSFAKIGKGLRFPRSLSVLLPMLHFLSISTQGEIRPQC